MLLDLMLPGTDGIDGIELMRDILDVAGLAAHLPVRLRAGEGRRQGLRDGAVDYVVKPFPPTELSARIKAALRRRVTAEPSEPYVLGDLPIDCAQRRVTPAGRRV